MTTHDDLNRDLGRMEGTLVGLGGRMDKLEQMVSDGFSKLNERLDVIERRESERKGGFRVAHWIYGAATGLIAFLAAHFLK
jgi:tetrahydromethanopterin S-methyltransferase subunit G